MTLALKNYQWAQAIINSLVQLGCIHFFIAPGSRSAPLSMACIRKINTETDLHYQTHFDERGLAFAALGAAKASKIPSVVITSSGSALGNLLPAVIEANQYNVPLILLTADRPAELINCGANQAIDQVGIFGHFVIANFNLPLPSEGLLASALGDFNRQLNSVLQNQAGVIHLNLPLKEPLYSTEETLPALNIPIPESLIKAPSALPDFPKIESSVVVVAGQLTVHEAAAVVAFAQAHNLPIFPDIGSQLRLLKHPLIISNIHYLLKTTQLSIVDNLTTVIQFGGRLTGKPLLNWVSQLNAPIYIIDQAAPKLDPNGNAIQWQIDPDQWATLFPNSQLHSEVLNELQTIDKIISVQLNDCAEQQFSEISAARMLCDLIPNTHDLFLGNSLAIRVFDQAGCTKDNSATLYCNRGASGIDGLTATAAGIAMANKKPMTAVIGDLSALYDLNSLYWLTKLTTSFILVIFNNDGGQIFKMLPAAKQTDIFEPAFSQPHHLDFEAFARGFNIDYHCANSLNLLNHCYNLAVQQPNASIIELSLKADAFIDHSAAIDAFLDAHHG